MGPFLSSRLDSFKFDSCRLKELGWSRGLFVRSFSMFIRLREVDSRLRTGLVVSYRFSILRAVFSLLIRPKLLAFIVQEGFKSFPR